MLFIKCCCSYIVLLALDCIHRYKQLNLLTDAMTSQQDVNSTLSMQTMYHSYVLH